MSRLLIAVVLGLGFALGAVSHASANDALTRRDGFMMLWSAIERPSDPWKKDAFIDVPKGDVGYDEITYAHGRGILDDTVDDERSLFHPDDPLIAQDAYLWLVRTRNVGLPDDLTPDALPKLLERYGLASAVSTLTSTLDREALLQAMRTFDASLASTVVLASNYGEELQGETTAFGEIFDWHQMTAAHRTLPYNTLVRVTNVDNGQSVVVRINDRGPYVEGRSLDLSAGAFMAIAPDRTGVIEVTMERLGDVSLVGPCTKEQRFARRVAPGVILSPGIPHVLRLGQRLEVQSRQWFVVRDVTYPDGQVERFEDWVAPGESFKLTPAVAGAYTLRISAADGRERTFSTDVAQCDAS